MIYIGIAAIFLSLTVAMSSLCSAASNADKVEEAYWEKLAQDQILHKEG